MIEERPGVVLLHVAEWGSVESHFVARRGLRDWPGTTTAEVRALNTTGVELRLRR